MTRLLSLFGLMRVSEHKRRTDSFFEQFESLNDDLDEMTDKYKEAVADLEKQAGEIIRLSDRLNSLYASPNWKAQGYKTREDEINDMADVGRSLMNRLKSVLEKGGEMEGWTPMDDPAEIVGDMANVIYELRAEINALRPDALAMRRKRQMDRDRRKGR